MQPFLIKQGKKTYIRLCKDLYTGELIEAVKAQEPKAISSVHLKGKYYFVDLSVDSLDDYFDFLNYLISFSRNK